MVKYKIIFLYLLLYVFIFVELIDSSFEENIENYENILDDLYGTSWREKKDDILPKSEKKPPRKRIEISLPKTER